MQLDQRLYLERSLAAEQSKRHQSAADHSEWEGMGFTARLLCHYDKILVVWKQGANGPQILGRLRIVNADASTFEGIGVCVEVSVGDGPDSMQWITHTPARLFGLPIFMHVPFINEITYTPEGRKPEKMVLRFPLVVKTAGNPNSPKLGNTYVTQIGEFRTLYPEFADLKL